MSVTVMGRCALLSATGLLVFLLASCSRGGRLETPAPEPPAPEPEVAVSEPTMDGSAERARDAGLSADVMLSPDDTLPAVDELPADDPGPVTELTLAEETILPDSLGITPTIESTPLPGPWVTSHALDERAGAYITYFTSRRGDDFSGFLNRMNRYEAFMRERIRAAGFPEELVYLPLIESGFNPRAVSRARAVGLWQFVAQTGRRYGLEVSALVDERRDPIAATDAALAYLGELRDRFNSWFLALAAYNSGENRIERILRTHFRNAEPSDSLFWLMRRYLPRETREYVPKFLAAVRIGLDPQAHGFELADVDPPLAYADVMVPDATSLDVIAKAAGASQDEIEDLNPHYLRGMTPVGRSATVHVPAGQAETFALNYARIPAKERVTFAEHQVRRGETLGGIARRYGVRLAELQAANPRAQARRLQIGQWLIVPRGNVARATLATRVEATGARIAAREQITHRVRAGETLWEISRQYGVSVGDLQRWNALSSRSTIYAGQVLQVAGARVVVYRVQPGDTLTAIASRHGLSASDLARFNNMDLNAIIRPGDEVRVPALTR